MPEQNTAQDPAKTIKAKADPIPSTGSKQTQVVPSTHSPSEEDHKTGKDKPKWTDVAVVFFTICLVGVAIWQGIIFKRQWQEMHSGGVDTHDLALAAKSQADASKAQADEAKEQVDKMSESLKKTDILIKEATEQATATNKLAIQAQRSADYAKQSIDTAVEAERPWVGVTFYKADDFTEGNTAKILIQYTNSGKRPATVSMTYGGAPFEKPPLFPEVIDNRAKSVGFMLPGASQSGTFSFAIPNNAFATWKAKHQIFYILAQIVYADVGTNNGHITNFCAYYDPTNKDLPFPLCTRYNEAK